MKYSSNQVTVFPCVNRDSSYLSASKLMSEQNITNIIKSITDKDSYIISWKEGLLKCVVKGYYFEISGVSQEGTKFMHLYMTNNLLVGDDATQFDGVAIDDDSTDSDLTLCVNGKIPPESYQKFKQDSLNVTSIKCPVIE